MAMKGPPQDTLPPQHHARRRWFYAANVLVALAAAAALVVVANLIVEWQYQRLGEGVKSWLRLDLTAERDQTLSPQTRQVLDDLQEPYHLTAVLRVDGPRSERIADLITRYRRESRWITATQIDPDQQPAELAAFYKSVMDRFAEQVQPLSEAVDGGLRAMQTFADELASLRTQLQQVTEAEDVTPEARQEVQLFDNKLSEVEAAYRRAETTLREALAQPLPPWSSARQDLLAALRRADAEVLQPLQREFSRRANNRDSPMAVRNALLRADAPLRALRGRIQPWVDALTRPADVLAYNQTLQNLQAGEVVVLSGESGLRVLGAEGLFVETAADPNTAGPNAALFLGEDRLTAALLTLQMEQPPRVILVHDQPGSVLEAASDFTHLIGRLSTADMALGEWRLAEAIDQTLAAPPNLTDDDAPTAWIVLPLSPERTGQAAREVLAQRLTRALDAGQGVLLQFAYDPQTQVRSRDPLLDLVEKWGIKPQLEQLVLHEGVTAQGAAQADAAWLVRTWPNGSPLSSALAGRPAQFVAASPLDLVQQPGKTVTAMVEVSAPRLWLAERITDAAALASSRWSAETAADSAVLAAGTVDTSGGGRLLVLAEPHWATDRQATRYAGNSELLMAGTYWLTGLDQAIAATPRTQAVRSVAAMTDGQMLSVRLLLLAALPSAALLLGVGVWLVRRRG